MNDSFFDKKCDKCKKAEFSKLVKIKDKNGVERNVCLDCEKEIIKKRLKETKDDKDRIANTRTT